MNSSLLKELKTFCKSNKITDKTLAELYKIFCNQKNHTIDCNLFELGMYSFNRAPIKNLKIKIAEYMKSEGCDCYEKFIREQQHISRELWDQIVGKNAILGIETPPSIPFHLPPHSQAKSESVASPDTVASTPEPKLKPVAVRSSKLPVLSTPITKEDSYDNYSPITG